MGHSVCTAMSDISAQNGSLPSMPTPQQARLLTWRAFNPARTQVERFRRGPDAALSHQSAAEFYGIGKWYATDRLDFTVPDKSRVATTPHNVVMHEFPLKSRDVDVVDGMPVTRPHRIVNDMVREHTPEDAVRELVHDVIKRGLVGIKEASSLIAPRNSNEEPLHPGELYGLDDYPEFANAVSEAYVKLTSPTTNFGID